jgi:hypothetical protein
MRVHPYTQAEFLTGHEMFEFEYSDRLLLPKSLFEGFDCAAGKITLLSISNSIGQTIAGTVYGAHIKQDIIYVPSWMYYSIDVTDNVLYSTIEQCVCSKLSIRPHHNNFIDVNDWTKELGKSLKRYISITEGSIISLIIHGVVQKFTIVGLYPYNHKTCILQNGDTIDINILKSLEDVKQEPILRYLYKKDDKDSKVLAFSCIGYKLGGESIPENSTKHGVLLSAVNKRLYTKQSNSLEIVEKPICQHELKITPEVTVDTINKFSAAAAQLRKERTIQISRSV